MIVPLIDLAPLVAFLVALGVCLLVAYFARAFFGTAAGAVGWIPYLGKVLSRSLLDVEHKITSIMGRAALALEARVGASWHSMARLADHIGRELASHAHQILMLAQLLPGASAISDLLRLIHFLQARAGAIESALHGIGHDVIDRIHAVERGIGADVLPRIRGLEREVGRDLRRERARARTAERATEREVASLRKWLLSHPWTAVTGAFVGSVAIALSRLGLDWIRCPTAKSFFQRRGCNAWNDLEALLLIGEVIGLVSLVELAREEQKVVGFVASAVRDVLEV